MNLVKKWIGCVVSFVAGVLGLALSACTGMTAVAKVDGSALAGTAVGDTSATLVDNTTKAFKVLTDKDLYTQAKELGIKSEFLTMKVFAIITLVVAVLLIAYSIVMLLKNLNVIKCEGKIFKYVGLGLIVLFLISTIGLFVASNGYANAMEDVMADVVKAQYGYGFTAKLTGLMDTTTISTLLGLHKYNVNVAIGVYQPVMLVVAIVSAIVVGVFTFIKRKEA